MKTISGIPVILMIAFFGLQAAQAFDETHWGVRCWNSDEKRWEDFGLEKMTVEEKAGVTTITNTSGVHKHAHFVFQLEPKGDFTFTIELKGGYELGFLDKDGKDEMLYLELDEKNRDFETYELSREGTRISIRKNGKSLPLVHFRFDYGEEFLITLALKDRKSAVIRTYAFENGN